MAIEEIEEAEVQRVQELARAILDQVNRVDRRLASFALDSPRPRPEAPTVIVVVEPGTRVVTVAPGGQDTTVEEELCQ